MRGLPLLAAVALLVLAGCAPTATSGAAAATSDGAPAAGGSMAATSPVDAAAAPADVVAASSSASPAPASPSTACRSDSDCAVKDVGSCCGYRPACVSADAETFPEQVKARCAAEGRVGICGFQPIAGCQCVEGRCAAQPGTVGPAPPKVLQ